MGELLIGFGEIARQAARRASFEMTKKRKRPLTQIELGRAYQVEIKVRREADRLLGNQDEVSRIHPKGIKLVIKRSTKLEIEEGEAHFTGADLGISTFERKLLGHNYYEWAEDYAFYRDRVDLRIGKNIHRKGKAPEQEVIETQANAKDLNALLKVLGDSKPTSQ